MKNWKGSSRILSQIFNRRTIQQWVFAILLSISLATPGIAQSWELIPGSLSQISVAADGTVWGVQANGNIYHHLGGNTWEPMYGSLSQVSVGSASNIWGVQNGGFVYHYKGVNNADASGWELIPGSLKNISAASDGTVWGVNENGTIWRYAGNNSWENIHGALKQVSVGSANQIWGVANDGAIYRYKGVNNADGTGWELIPGGLTNIAAGSDGSVFGVAAGNIYRFVNNDWQLIPGGLVQVSVRAANNVWGVNAAGEIYNYSNKPPAAVSGGVASAYTYRIRHKVSRLNLCQYSYGKEDSHNVGVYGEEKDEGIKWILEDAGDGYVHLIYKNNGMSLCVSSDNYDNNYTAVHYDSGIDAFKWKMTKAPGGYYMFINKFTGKGLTQYNGGTDGDHREATQFAGAAITDPGFLWALEPIDVPAPITRQAFASSIPEATKLDLLMRYAPHVALAPGEEYLPASTEWAFKHLIRYMGADGLPDLMTITPLSSPSDDSNPLFKGNDGIPGAQGIVAPVYAFWSENTAGVNLVYNFYYGYNRGKEVAGSIYGNHVGDWEHITVRLEKSGQEWAPTKVYYSAHDGGELIAWNDVQKIENSHPIVFAAKGSHGCYSKPGNVEYGTAVGSPLIDYTSGGGVQWSTWRNVVALDYNAQVRLNPPSGQTKESAYPYWMGLRDSNGKTDYFRIYDGYIDRKDGYAQLKAGTFNWPYASAVNRWGNGQMSGNAGDAIIGGLVSLFKPSAKGDVVRFVAGAGGPQNKDMFGVNLN